MAKIALRAYNQEIESLIDARQIDEAIAHCRHILKTFPKHIQTYRLLGKAFLESQRYADAGDILGRVLSSIPDDFIAHVGMSVIREDEGNLVEAIYHMERAFEVQPSNKAIQEELRRLYGRRDGFAPPKVRLSRGALARMYARGELYPQAIAELRAALAENPERLDLRLLLARNYLRMGQRVEAVDACNLLLRKLPYCLEANQIMATVLQNSERAADAAGYRRRVATLDPYEAYVSALIPDASRVPDATVTVDLLSWQPGMPLVAGDYQPEWAASLGVHVPEEYPGLDEFPDWLGDAQSSVAEKPAAKGPALVEADGVTPLKDETAETAAAGEIPDWMQQAGWQPGTGAAQEGPVFFDEEGEDVLAGAEEELSGLPEAELPDWVREMAPPAGLAAATQPEEWISEGSLSEGSLSEGSLSEAAPGETLPGERLVEAEAEELGELLAGAQAPAEAPEWLEELGSAQSGAEKAEKIEAPEEELPEWLKDLEADETPVQAAAPAFSEAGEGGEEAIPDWLAEAAGEEEASDEVSTWLTEAAPQVVEESGLTEEIAAEAGSMPDWLSGEAEFALPAEGLAGAGTKPEVAAPDWLKGAQAEGEAAAEAEAEPAVAAEPAAEAGRPVAAFDEEIEITSSEEAIPAGAPDWLKTAQAEAEPAVEAGSPVAAFEEEIEITPSEEAIPAGAPDWLKAAQAEAEPAVEAGSPVAAFEEEIEITPAEEELPDWLKTAQAESATAAEAEPAVETGRQAAAFDEEIEITPSEEEIPDWLKAAQAEQTPVEAFEAEEIEITPSEDEIPDWLKAAQVEQTPTATIEAEVEIEPAREEELPDWLKGVPEAGVPEAGVAAAGLAGAAAAGWQAEGEQPEAEAAPETPPVVEAELPDWLLEAEAEETAVELAAEAGLPAEAGFEVEGELEAIELEPADEAGIPDWLKAARAGEAPGFEAPAAETTPEVEEEAGMAAETELPDWMAEMPAGEAAEVSAEPVAEAEPPDWMKAFQATTGPAETSGLWEEEAESEPEAEAEAGQAPTADWLAALETPVEEGDTRPGRTMLASGLAGVGGWQAPEAPPVEEAGEAVEEAGTMAAEGELPAAELAAEPPDWMRELAPEQAETEAAELEAEIEAAQADEEAFAGLFGEAEEPGAELLAGALPAAAAMEEESLAWAEEESAAGEGAVEALAGLQETEALAAVELPAADLPDWLRSLAPEQAETEAVGLEEEIEAAQADEAAFAGLFGEVEEPGAVSLAEAGGLASDEAERQRQREEDEFMNLFAAEGETATRGLDLAQVEAEEVEAALLAEEVAPALAEPEAVETSVLAEEVTAAAEEEVEAIAPETAEEQAAEASLFAELDAMASSEHGRGFAAALSEAPEAGEAEIEQLAAEPLAVEPLAVEQLAAELATEAAEFEAPEVELAAAAVEVEEREAQSPEITAAAAEMPDFGDDMEAAFAWLEGLAARQGAQEALFTAPEDRPEAPPEWVASAVEEIPPVEAVAAETEEFEFEAPAVEAEAEPAAELPAGMAGEVEGELAGFVEAETRGVELPAEGELAAAVEEAPGETIIEIPPPAAEALDVRTAWLGVEDFVPVDEEVAEAAEEKPELPAWLQEAEQAESQAAPEVEAWAPPVTPQPAAPPRPPVDLNKAGLVDLERLPGVGFTLAQKILDQRDQIGAFNSVMDLGQITGVTPDILQELEGLVTVEAPKSSITAPHLRVEGPDDLLAARQAFLAGDAGGALEQYSRLIRQRRFMPDIVRDLEKAVETNPRQPEIWQVLGDAYLRDDQLQPALEAYAKVEELLR